jgi:hypothetical protein
MDSEEQARRLRMHVEQLAGTIGERNIFCPAALQAAAFYIEHEWEQQGYAVRRLAYDVSGVHCLNLEVTRSGRLRQRKILLIGAHYDTVTGSPGANDNASGVSALLEISRRPIDDERSPLWEARHRPFQAACASQPNPSGNTARDEDIRGGR